MHSLDDRNKLFSALLIIFLTIFIGVVANSESELSNGEEINTLSSVNTLEQKGIETHEYRVITIDTEEILESYKYSSEPIDKAVVQLETLEDELEDTEELDVRTDYGTLDNLKFTVDITDNLAESKGLIIGNTSTEKSYSGIIEIEVPAGLVRKVQSEMKLGKTYIIETSPMLSRSYPPTTTMVSFEEADEAEIEELEQTRKKISNYSDCMEQYEKMDINEIIDDANMNYATWTQEQIGEFIDYIYSEKNIGDNEKTNKLYVAHRESLNSSIIGENYISTPEYYIN